ncbi:hypothetical protein EDB85DRAFT_2021845 [Lactarius pseudohatsudake]|nr:hypothetical protein EDB85DRAFT_2021845 [Lactarius pseudohatsudake]
MPWRWTIPRSLLYLGALSELHQVRRLRPRFRHGIAYSSLDDLVERCVLLSKTNTDTQVRFVADTDSTVKSTT